MPSVPVLRAAVGCCAALALGGLAAAPASAASADLTYQCEYAVGDVSGSGDAVASWDTAIADDGSLRVQVGDTVSLDPYTGEITLPDELVAELRAQEVAVLDVSGLQLTIVDETGQPYILELSVDPTPVPAEGPLTLTARGVDPEPVEVTEPGPYTLVAVAFFLATGDLEDPGPTEGMTYVDCVLPEDSPQDQAVDTFVAAAAPVPTVTVTPTPEVTVTASPAVTVTATPVRPVLVQTDAPAGPTGLGAPAVAGAGLTALLLGALVARRRPERRH
ncbi:hypothetical protein [Phycicoccus flavus]|uniref:LPXTG-motif cell wall anchor domain-containing protein n=1 Tax=Phycicoccus flavus TaxID=2502783 RepID=A0A8T6R7S8_9MICO|nr:hypothetical protein [Phycicoccus flavus]NHA69792.1 hypothetical protein [Phycicoccus flavus]